MTREQAGQIIDELFGSWGPALLRCALRRLESRPAAEDVVQEAFMALYRELRRGTLIQNPKAWTMGVVRRQCARHIRELARHGEEAVPIETLEMWGGTDDALEPARSFVEQIAGLAAGLSGREEEVLLLRLQSLKYREIASQLGISPKSVATHLARALRKLENARKGQAPGRPLMGEEGHVPKTLQ